MPVATTDAAGRLLGRRVLHFAHAAFHINFAEGSVWSETAVGTNAPGLCWPSTAAQVVGPGRDGRTVVRRLRSTTR